MKTQEALIAEFETVFHENIKFPDYGSFVNMTAVLKWLESTLTQVAQESRKSEIKFLKDLKLGFDVWRCDCGEPWKDTDGADMVKERLALLKSPDASCKSAETNDCEGHIHKGKPCTLTSICCKHCESRITDAKTNSEIINEGMDKEWFGECKCYCHQDKHTRRMMSIALTKGGVPIMVCTHCSQEEK